MYGRQAVLEVLATPDVTVERVLLDRSVRGPFVDQLLDACAARGVRVERVAAERVGRASGNPRQDQGVVADVAAPGIVDIDEWLATAPAGAVFVLDGVSNPANVGMVLRVAVAAGMAATVVPPAGVPDVGPLVVKASAGVALRAPIVRAATALAAVRALRGTGADVLVLEAGGRSLWTWEAKARAGSGSLVAFVLGNETTGVSPEVAALATGAVAVPLEGGVESLNVATAAAVVAFELQRRRLAREGD